ncbi:hypothetical protein LRS74_10420 [Streptomyces sp. LX-29]|uniref:hypothetical protein n=1 Tax=Streptomyces sp. LX-29 TaxID=2900152 RepID=UPI00240CE97D|nr:hypothetical protein [Streptomyces sp. LX-29]WFB11978.1 hypothetical protein LRS74_10420 [Streptomyces sp. LX-29]
MSFESARPAPVPPHGDAPARDGRTVPDRDEAARPGEPAAAPRSPAPRRSPPARPARRSRREGLPWTVLACLLCACAVSALFLPVAFHEDRATQECGSVLSPHVARQGGGEARYGHECAALRTQRLGYSALFLAGAGVTLAVAGSLTGRGRGQTERQRPAAPRPPAQRPSAAHANGRAGAPTDPRPAVS